MANQNIVLLTGANGFIGSQIAKRLLNQPNTKIIALVKAKNNIEAKNRLCKAWWDWPELHNSISTKTIALAADVRKKKLGLSEKQYNDLTQSLTHIIHCAAKWRFDTEIEELHKTNVEGTKNIIALTKSVNKNHKILRLSYISSAYVSGKLQGNISEEALTDKYGFITEYEQTKFQGEKLVQLEKNNFPISIFRPTMVIGDSKTGEITTFNTVYTLLRLYLLGKLRYLPMNPSTRVNIVPVDYVAETITKLTFSEPAVGLTFHLTPNFEDLPTVRELADSVQKWVKENLKISLPKLVLFSLPNKVQKPLIRTWAKLTNAKKFVRLMDVFSFYFQTKQTFERKNLEKLAGDYQFDWQELVSPILKYAIKHGFLHRTERTVHEQILFRLNSRNMPVNLFDIVEEKIVHRPNKEVKKEILEISSALQNMGIIKGDLVALIGFNSVRYLALDVAIGLIGAVSVPLYYTSALTEIERIIKTSKAKILFIGTPKLLEKLSKINLSIPMIDFCRNQSISTNPNIISWEDFQIKTSNKVKASLPSLTFSDLSTIRYTAGSTGENKGVCFNHANIRWLAETVGSLFPWKIRNKEVTYLSFLPLNHVVEGIMGAYAPFYEPTKINLYFLENFYELQKMLPKVRPVVFFSVPRFYEKVWEAFRKTKMGISYLDSRNQIKKKIIRKFLKKPLLKKAGLDRCIQLIVGSAPCSEKLLLDFRDLGIEVYNAYGLTEAPLITINRIGKNHIGTVGQPLPETDLKEAEDGELLVKGPQVMLGYLNEEATNIIENGWLHTGDLGRINKYGDLIIRGRKKELIATSYGKMISPFKIESMLKGLDGVEEAMIIGEGKPYVSALIWSNEAEKRPETVNIINNGIEEVNSNLSRAEQIRTWAILKNDLKIEFKDLTPNFKLKRANISNRFTIIIESLYNQKNVIDSRIIETRRTKN